jgi:NADH-quinone oxidoreductase subunit L
VLYWIGMTTAFLTAVYTFRAFFLTFYGPERVPHEAGHHAHESPRAMTAPLVILALFALSVGAYFEWTGGFEDFLGQTPSLVCSSVPKAAEHSGMSHLLVMSISTVGALAGVGIAAFLFLGDPGQAAWLARVLLPLYLLSAGKFFFDQIYGAIFVWPLWLLALVSNAVDRYVIDGLVNLVGRIPPLVAWGLRSLQTGMVQFYALAMIWGVVVLVITLLVWPVLGGSFK